MAFGEGNENWVKAPWFIAINPNGRIPALQHQGNNVFETSAIIEYLAEVYDKDRKLSFSPATNLKEWADQQSWTYFAVSLIGTVLVTVANFFFPIAWRAWTNGWPGWRLLQTLGGHVSVN